MAEQNPAMETNVRTSFQSEIASNKRKSMALIAVVFLILAALLYVIAAVYTGAGSAVFLIIGLLFSGVYVATTYFYGDQIVLSTTGAKPIDERNPKHVFLKNTVENLAFAARLPKVPAIYIIESGALNAFATGRDPDHASIAVTTGLLNTMNRNELEGVIAHELSHISNYDIRFSLLVACMVGLIAILSHMFLRSMMFSGGGGSDRKGGALPLILIGIVLAIFAPIIVRMVQAAVSRKRESLADATGAKLTRYPEGLASALEKIKAQENRSDAPKLNVSEAESHLFFSDPVKSHLDGLFATHPPLEERIKTLRAM